MRKIACSLVLMILAGCATTAPQAARDNHVAGTSNVRPGSLVVLVQAEQHDPFLTPGDALLLNQLHRQLSAGGFRVAALDAANHALVWRQEVDAVGGVFDPVTGAPRAASYAQAAGNLARRICAEAGCALLLRYRLVRRDAVLAGTTAEWDGQRRHQPVSNAGGQGLFTEGRIDAVSVELQGLAADGQLVLRTHGGASLPFSANVAGRKYDLRTDLFESDDEIADGVRLALAPLLAPR